MGRHINKHESELRDLSRRCMGPSLRLFVGRENRLKVSNSLNLRGPTSIHCDKLVKLRNMEDGRDLHCQYCLKLRVS